MKIITSSFTTPFLLVLSLHALANYLEMSFYNDSLPFIVAVLVTFLAFKFLKIRFEVLLLSTIFLLVLLNSIVLSYIVAMI